jgi:hypothetical protein
MFYIFLSNRVYPNPKTNKLASMNIRTQIQSELYHAVSEKSQEKRAGVAGFGN